MTIDNLVSGETLNALIHTALLKRCPYEAAASNFCKLCGDPGDSHEIPPYSTNLKTAMGMLNDIGFRSIYIWWNDSGSMWQVRLDYRRKVEEDCQWSACDDGDEKSEPNLALAICRCALKSTYES